MDQGDHVADGSLGRAAGSAQSSGNSRRFGVNQEPAQHAADYVRGLAAAFLGIFRHRPRVHVVRCKASRRQNAQPSFARPWNEVIGWEHGPNDDARLLAHLVEPFDGLPALWDYALSKSRGGTSLGVHSISAGAWHVQCSHCERRIDLPLPPSPEELMQQVETAGISLFAQLLASDISSDWVAAASLQRALYVGLCNVPCVSGIVVVGADRQPRVISTTFEARCNRGKLTSKDPSLRRFAKLIVEACQPPQPPKSQSDWHRTCVSRRIGVRELCDLLLPGQDEMSYFNEELERKLSPKEIMTLLTWDRLGRPFDASGRPLTSESYPEDTSEFLRMLADVPGRNDLAQDSGLLYRLPLHALYFIAAMARCSAPASLFTVPLKQPSASADPEHHVFACFLVPDLTGNGDVLRAVKKGRRRPGESPYWHNGDKDWHKVFSEVRDTFIIPRALVKQLVKVDTDADAARIDDFWFNREPPHSSDQFVAAEHLCPDPQKPIVFGAIQEAEQTVREKLGLEERQLWTLKTRSRQQEPVFDVLVFDGLASGSLGAGAAAAGPVATDLEAVEGTRTRLGRELSPEELESGDWLGHLNALKTHFHKAVGVVGDAFYALRPCCAISVIGDLRTMKHTGAHGAQPLDETEPLGPGIQAEYFFYVRNFADYYAFPILVAGRMWGLLTYQLRRIDGRAGRGSDGERRNIGHDDFLAVLHGASAARSLGAAIEKSLTHAHSEALEQTLAQYHPAMLDADSSPKDPALIRDLLREGLTGMPIVVAIADAAGHEAANARAARKQIDLSSVDDVPIDLVATTAYAHDAVSQEHKRIGATIVSAIRRAISHRQNYINAKRAERAQQWQYLLQSVAHEIGHTIPALDQLLVDAHQFEAPRDARVTWDARASLAYLKLLVAAFGTKRPEAGDLLRGAPNAGGLRADNEVFNLWEIACAIGFKLSGVPCEPTWPALFARQTWEQGRCLRVELGQASLPDSGTDETYMRRCGTQVLFVSILSNMIQHLANPIAQVLFPDEVDKYEPHIRFNGMSPAQLEEISRMFEVEITAERLVASNLGNYAEILEMERESRPGVGKSSHIGTKNVVEAVLNQRQHFGWNCPGSSRIIYPDPERAPHGSARAWFKFMLTWPGGAWETNHA